MLNLPERYAVLVLFFLIFCGSAQAQNNKIGFRNQLWGFADNREYKTPYTTDKTIFGTRLSPQLYFEIEDKHVIHGGVHYSKDFGSRSDEQWNPIIYYKYKSEPIDFYLGHIPRLETLHDIPKIVMADTFLYDRPNLEGMMLHVHTGKFEQKLYIDWTSKQSKQDREQFIAGLSGRYTIRNFHIANDLMLWHNALSDNDFEDEHIQDNGIAMFRGGFDGSTSVFLDSLTVDAGIAVGFDRVRSEYDFRYATGFISNIYAQYRQLLLRNTLYIGDSQQLPNADRFYRSKRYNRLDIGWIPFSAKGVKAELSLSFHFTPGFIDNQQQFSLLYTFDHLFLKTGK